MLDVPLLLAILGMVNHQVAHIVTVGVIFEDFRSWVTRTFGSGSKTAYLVTCHLCLGTWVGLFEGCLIADRLGITGIWLADAVLAGFAIAMIGRFWNELLALAAASVSSMRREPEPMPTSPSPLILVVGTMNVADGRGDRVMGCPCAA